MNNYTYPTYISLERRILTVTTFGNTGQMLIEQKQTENRQVFLLKAFLLVPMPSSVSLLIPTGAMQSSPPSFPLRWRRTSTSDMMCPRGFDGLIKTSISLAGKEILQPKRDILFQIHDSCTVPNMINKNISLTSLITYVFNPAWGDIKRVVHAFNDKLTTRRLDWPLFQKHTIYDIPLDILAFTVHKEIIFSIYKLNIFILFFI